VSDPTVPWLAAAFIVVWLVLGFYLVRLHRTQRHLDRRLADLKRKSDQPPH
jgi:CcmD family protein